MIPIQLITLMFWLAEADGGNLIHFSLSASALILIGDRVWERFVARRKTSNGDTPKEYWDGRLDQIESIAKRQTEILEAQNAVFTRLVVIAESQERRQMTEDSIRAVRGKSAGVGM